MEGKKRYEAITIIRVKRSRTRPIIKKLTISNFIYYIFIIIFLFFRLIIKDN